MSGPVAACQPAKLKSPLIDSQAVALGLRQCPLPAQAYPDRAAVLSRTMPLAPCMVLPLVVS